MRIGIDATLLRPDRLTGVERYAAALVTGLAKKIPKDLVLFLRGDAPEAVRNLPVEHRSSPLSMRLPADQAWLPAAAKRAKVDVLHTLAFPTPVLWRGRSVMTVHDATPWLFPKTLSLGMKLYYKPLFPQALRRAAAVCTVSKSARNDLAGTGLVSPTRIHVTPNGVADEFFWTKPGKKRGAPYLLAVGTIEPRKNLQALVDALRILRSRGRDLSLVIAGRKGWEKELVLGDMASYVQILGPVPDAELPALYANASCYVTTSFYEGFGLPLVEAMACGIPAVASDIPVLREVGGDTVLYADPSDPNLIALKIGEATLPTGAHRVAKAKERARSWSWDACVERTLEVYATVEKAI